MREPNTTPTGEPACAFSTPWLDHFDPPVGTGKGCVACAEWPGEETRTRKTQ